MMQGKLIKRSVRALMAASLLLLTAQVSADKVLMESNGVSVYESDIERYIDSLIAQKKQLPKLDAATINQLVEIIYVNRTLAKAAATAKAVDADQIRWLGQFQIDEALKEALLTAEAEKAVASVNLENTAADFYEKQKDTFIEDIEVRASHILVNIVVRSDEEAQKLIAEIKNKADAGEDFAALAKQYSEDPSAKRNSGDLGYFKAGQMVKPFEQVAFALKAGEISEPVKTPFGYHIIKHVDKRGGQPKPFSELKETLMAELKKSLVAKYKVDRVNFIATEAKSKPDVAALEKLVSKYSKSQEKTN